jgi:arylsulfatase A-like enzyme
MDMRPTFLLSLLLIALAGSSPAAGRPNFVFLVSEDNSVHYLRLYGADLGVTPHIERMAAQGLTFNHAFSCAPVCSVARSTLATGMFAPRGGFQYHRKSAPAALPPGFEPWSATLRKAGYYTANNSKTDYNFVHNLKELWDDSSNQADWRNRTDQSQPFFFMQSFGQSHESSLHFPADLMEKEKTTTPPDQVKLAPFHPDTPTFRYTHARYFDRIRLIDELAGGVLAKLQEDGLLEDTFVFYFGDHGGVLPRGKGYAYETGLHVPLVVRIPENWRHLVDHPPGARTDGFVSFVDFGPTVLHLAGLDVPELMDGRPFLGKGVTARDLAARDTAFGYADRMDEKFDLVRTLRQGRYTYLRNFTGFYPDGMQNNYRYRMLAYTEWRELFRAGKLNDVQGQFFRGRPAEQLFDFEADPYEVNNLAGDPAHRAKLIEMRGLMQQHLRAIHDLSFYPESHMVAEALSNGVAYGRQHGAEIRRLADIADLQLASFAGARDRIAAALASANPWERYWACLVCTSHGKAAAALAPEVRKLLTDDHAMVRVRAAEFLGTIQAADPMPTLYGVLNTVTTEQEVMLAFNTVVYLRDHCGHAFDPAKLDLKYKGGEVNRRTSYLAGISEEDAAPPAKNKRGKKRP